MKKNVLLGGGRAALSLLLALLVFLFWWQCYPHALSYQEQYQLFPWTGGYLARALAVPGGLAAWLGEFIVQFYYLPWLGALCVAAVYVALQWLTGRVMDMKGRCWHLLSLLPPLLLLWLMGDESVLLAYAVALVLTLLLFVLARRVPSVADAVLIPLAYWCLGPVAWLYVLLRLVDGGWHRLWMPLWLMALQLAAYHWLLPEWPLYSVLTGQVYYRIPLHTPALLWVIPVVIVLLFALARLPHRRWMWAVEAAVVVAVAFLAINKGYDREKYELIRQDYLVRNERWSELIDRAEQYQVRTPFSSVCVNLALAQRRQLADRMFDFYQSGPDALIMPRTRDLTSMLPSAEAFWHLGMVNSAQRYMFDTQESILNAKKSGRCTQRIAECMMVNGHYDTAAKQLQWLKKSLFYRKWAVDAEKCLYHDNLVNAHPVWGKKRKLRFKNDFIYSYPELDKMFGILFETNHDNKMALDYMFAQLLLNGNVPAFAQLLPQAEKYGGHRSMPLVYQDVVNCLQHQGKVVNSPFMNYFNRQRAKGGLP